MAEPERILTLHPAGKQGVRIAKDMYDAMAGALLAVIPRAEPGVRFTDLDDLVLEHLPEALYPGGKSVQWYLTTVKLDLEARGAIRRLKGSPQRLVRVG